jgi:hypothetical protein
MSLTEVSLFSNLTWKREQTSQYLPVSNLFLFPYIQLKLHGRVYSQRSDWLLKTADFGGTVEIALLIRDATIKSSQPCPNDFDALPRS